MIDVERWDAPYLMGHMRLCQQTVQSVKESFKTVKMEEGNSYRDHSDSKIRLKSGYLQQVHAVKKSSIRHDYRVPSCTPPGKLACANTCTCATMYAAWGMLDRRN